jgi:methyl-accepting chemotaxis protein
MTAFSRLTTQGGDVPARSLLPVDPVQALLDRVLSRTESTFVTAGTRLETAVDAIRGMQGLFAQMQAQLSPEQGVKLLDLVSVTKSALAEVEHEFDSFLKGSMGLRRVVRAVRVEVEDLDRVVRTIANVSINARIQASRLNPPRPQVTAFLERLSDMVAEAEGSLFDVKSAMAGILNRLIAMDEVTVTLQTALKQEVLPALARFAAQGQSVHDGQDELLRTSDAVAVRMRGIFAEVSRLVVGLQSGDATRQRLERVREIVAFSAAQGVNAPATEALLVQLADRLAQAALTEARREGADAVAGIGAVLDGARDALKTATDFYFGHAGERVVLLTSDSAKSGHLETRLDLVRDNLGRLDTMASDVRVQVEKILMQETRLRQISHQVRLSGLNAVLICAKLGEEGRSLRELAQWLRHLTDESDTITARMQSALDRTRDQLTLTGSDRIDQLRRTLAGFLENAGALQAQLAGIDACLSGAVEMCRTTDHSLGLALGGARDTMSGYHHSLQDVSAASLLLQGRLATLPPPDLPVMAQSAASDILAEIRRRYTMQSERDLHDGLIGVEAAQPEAALPSQSSAQTATNDDLDDIFF